MKGLVGHFPGRRVARFATLPDSVCENPRSQGSHPAKLLFFMTHAFGSDPPRLL